MDHLSSLTIEKMLQKFKFSRQLQVMSEEHYTGHLKFKEYLNEPFITIDPLDGSKNYEQGKMGYVVQLAFVLRNIPFVGVIYHPESNATFVGIKGFGAYRLRSPASFDRSVRLSYKISPTFIHLVTGNHLRQNEVLLNKCIEGNEDRWIHRGSVGYKAMLICNQAQSLEDKELFGTPINTCVYPFKMNVWDAFPPEPIVTETLINGVPIRYCDFNSSPLLFTGKRELSDGLIMTHDYTASIVRWRVRNFLREK